MERIKIYKHIIGYAIGITIFGLLIPHGLYGLAKAPFPFLNFSMIGNCYIKIALGSLLLAIGMVFITWSNIVLFKIGKGGPADGFGVAVSPRTEKLVIKGSYVYTRNPMVFGAFMCYFSIGIFCNSLSIIVLLLFCIPLIIIYLKLTEEKRLYKDFGNDFVEYKKKVSMIFPFLRK